MIIRPMGATDCEAVAAMVRRLAAETRPAETARLDTNALHRHGLGPDPLIDVVVAEDGGAIAGACLGLITFSTWRGAPGLYIVDLFVEPDARGRGIGDGLLRASARRAAGRGATFVKLEVDTSNAGAVRFYERLGFQAKADDRLFVLEARDMNTLLDRA